MRWINLLSIMSLFITGCESLFFYPEKELIITPHISKYSPQDIYFLTTDGLKLHGWLFTKETNNKGIILHLHGNAENISTHINSIIWLFDEGFNIFTFDYRGYGKSEGKPTIHGIHLDANAALEKIIQLQEIHRNRIFVLGQSLGASVAVYTVATSKYKSQIKAVILDSPFASYRKIVKEKASEFALVQPLSYVLQFLIPEKYSPDIWIEKLPPAATFIIHGEKDRIIDPYHSLILFKKAAGIKELIIVPGADHIQGFASIEVRKRLIEFLNSIN